MPPGLHLCVTGLGVYFIGILWVHMMIHIISYILFNMITLFKIITFLNRTGKGAHGLYSVPTKYC
jgi:hypothetical protein